MLFEQVRRHLPRRAVPRRPAGDDVRVLQGGLPGDEAIREILLEAVRRCHVWQVLPAAPEGSQSGRHTAHGGRIRYVVLDGGVRALYVASHVAWTCRGRAEIGGNPSNSLATRRDMKRPEKCSARSCKYLIFNEKGVAGGPGFEPRLTESESHIAHPIRFSRIS